MSNKSGPAILLGLLFLLGKRKKNTTPLSNSGAGSPATNAGSGLPPGPKPSIADQVSTAEETPVDRQRIVLGQKIQFAKAKASVLPVSFPLLNEVADALRTNPSVIVSIEGHTSSEGSPGYNMKLSQARADAVRDYLEVQGIEPDRMIAKGFGEDAPLASNSSEAGRERNRRVEFFIASE